MGQAPAPDGLIPKLLHLMWVGSEPSPELRRNLARLQELNEGWKVRLWRAGQMDWLRNRDLFDAWPTAPGKSNIFRYEVIHKYGGYWLDADFEWLRPLPPAYFPTPGLVVAPSRRGAYSTGIIGAPAGHPFLQRLIERLPASAAAHPGATSQVVSGPVFFTKELEEWRDAHAGQVHEIPRDLIYPYYADKIERDAGPWAPGVVSVHHFSQARSLRARYRAGEWLMDQSRRLGLRRRGRNLMWSLTQLPRHLGSSHPTDGSDPRPARRHLAATLEGSDCVVLVGDDATLLAPTCCQLLSPYGRVFALPDTAVQESHLRTLERQMALADGPEVVTTGPDSAANPIELVSRVRMIVVDSADSAHAHVKALEPIVVSGRVDFVLIRAQAEDGRAAPDLGGFLARWRDLGAQVGAVNAGWQLLDCRGMRSATMGDASGSGRLWRLTRSGG